MNIPHYSKTSWITKLGAIVPEFVEFDKQNRIDYSNVYSEVKGSLELDILGKKINIMAIADRIAVNNTGNAVIIDYKTGSVPTKKDVLSGLSPQLIIEAIILSENGFPIKVREIEKLIYVKINSSDPYIKTIEIPISKDDISSHKEGLISLLEHYMKNKSFIIEQNLMQYDDYAHLARGL